MSPRLHIIYDVRGWAYFNVADALRRYAPFPWRVTTSPVVNTVSEDIKEAHAVLLMPFGHAGRIRRLLARHNPQCLLVGDVNVGIHHWSNDAVHEMVDIVDYVVHNNRESYEHYGSQPSHHHITNGVDLNIFRNLVPIQERPRRVLWVGSRFHAELKGAEVMREIEPALARHGIELDLRVVDSHDPAMTPAEMCDWYNSGSVYVVASKSEGTPNPGLESAACGCALVATRVGNMPELLTEDRSRGVLVTRDPKAILEGILYAMQYRAGLSRQLRLEIARWSWAEQARKYFEWFGGLVGVENATPVSSTVN